MIRESSSTSIDDKLEQLLGEVQSHPHRAAKMLYRIAKELNHCLQLASEVMTEQAASTLTQYNSLRNLSAVLCGPRD